MSLDDAGDIRPDYSPGTNYAYATIPEWILYADIGAQAVRLFCTLDRYVGANASAWPSRATLARKLGCSRETIDRALDQLERIGAVVVRRRQRDNGEWTSSEYSTWPRCAILRPHLGAKMPLPRGTNDDTRSNPIEGTTSKQLSIAAVGDDPQTKSSSIETSFNQAWEHYPRKVARKAALRAYTATVKAKRATPMELLTATRNYAVARIAADSTFTLHGATFYGPTERWRDYVVTTDGIDAENRAERDRRAARDLEEQRAREHAMSKPMPAHVKANLAKLRGNL